MKTTDILGIKINTDTKERILEYLFEDLLKSTKKDYIVTPNPEIIVHAVKHPHFKAILNEAALALPDGIGISLAGMLLGRPKIGRITGTDFMLAACEKSVEKRVSIGLLGGKPGIAKETAECLQKKYPGLEIAFVDTEPDKLLKSPRSLKLDLLFVAFGHPKQEEWIATNLEQIPVKVAMGVGGAFDYISGSVPRAPKLVRSIGLEWLYRLIRQPWRWKRQLALIEFVWMVVREKLER